MPRLRLPASPKLRFRRRPRSRCRTRRRKIAQTPGASMSTTTPLRYTNSRPEVHAEQARTLPAQHYTDAALSQREMRAIHYDMWLHAGRTEQLPEAGSYFRVRFAGVDVVVLRGEGGEITAFHNTCRHRGTLLC